MLMPSNNRRVEYVYIKNGDVISDLARIDAAKQVELQSGPDAFLFDFLRLVDGKSVLLLSTSTASRSLQYRPNVQALTIRLGGNWVAKLIAKPVLLVRVLYCLYRTRPKWLLCGANREPLWASFIYAKLTRTPLVHSRHNRVSVGTGSAYQRLSSALDSACIRRISGVICHGPYLRNELTGVGVPAAKIQEFDVALGAFRENADSTAIDTAWLDADDVVVLYSGRIEELKGIFDLLEALESRLHKDASLSLLYAGQGAASDPLNEAINARGLDGQAKLIGRLPHHALAGLMSRCKVVVTPTRTKFAEGRCMVVMEAQVLGIPVIAPDFGPFPYLIQHKKNGLLYEPDSIVNLAANLDILLDNDALYAQLCAGAKRSGDALLVPPLTFGQAVARAFNITPRVHKDSLMQGP